MADFIGASLSKEKPSLYIKWLNLMGILFIPTSIVTAYISLVIFRQGWVGPYPNGIFHTIVFIVAFIAIGVTSFSILKKKSNDN